MAECYLTWLGHAAFLAETGGMKLLFDPFIQGNPACPIHLVDLPAVDVVFVSHGHADHLGDAIEIASRCDALLVSNVEIAEYCHSRGVPRTLGLQPGGSVRTDFGTVRCTTAIHGSPLPGGRYGGVAAGFVVTAGGVVLYHAGDTALTSDMAFLARFGIHAAMLPCGDHFTMGVDDCAQAVCLVSPRWVIPMHYGTWRVIQVAVEELPGKIRTQWSALGRDAAAAPQVLQMSPGERRTLSLQ